MVLYVMWPKIQLAVINSSVSLIMFTPINLLIRMIPVEAHSNQPSVVVVQKGETQGSENRLQ
jgi:hypothetical protein